MIISGAATAFTWINVSLFWSVGYRTISRSFRLSQPYWVRVFAWGGSYHFPSLSSASPLPHLYLCSTSVTQSSPCRLEDDISSCFSAVLAGCSLQSPYASHLLFLPHFSLHLPVLQLLPDLEWFISLKLHCFTAIALPVYPWLHFLCCFL